MIKVKAFFRWLLDELDPHKSWTQAFIQGCLCLLMLLLWDDTSKSWVTGLQCMFLGAFLYRGLSVRIMEPIHRKIYDSLYKAGYTDGVSDLKDEVIRRISSERETVPETPISKEENNV